MSKDKENKTVNINLRVSEKTKADLVKLADQDQRSLSDYIRLQLEKLALTSKK
jgi:predicted HicB family RNase H-like nuclease